MQAMARLILRLRERILLIRPVAARFQLLLGAHLPRRAVRAHLVERGRERGERRGDGLEPRRAEPVDEALLERHAGLCEAVARGRHGHGARALEVALEEELVRHAHRPAPRRRPRLHHVGDVRALEDELHLEVLVYLHSLPPRRARRFRMRDVRAQFREVLAVLGDIGGEDHAVHVPADLVVLDGAQPPEEIHLTIHHNLEGAEGVVLLEEQVLV
mmetsp:Transcript_14282/g.33034  ORF Transcript_14282/g.33034 Transcript_14282/m.33034 type:complete len:215 (+) Transcript_14282:333-977(+)